MEWLDGIDFRLRALAVALPIALICSVLSVFVVLRRMAFIGQGVSHAGFGGISLAVLLGHWFEAFNRPLVRNGVTAAFCIATALAIGLYSRRRRVTEDSAIGILLVAAMALGAVFLSIRVYVLGDTSYVPSWESLLFGSLLVVHGLDLLTAYILAVVVLGTVALLYKELVSFTYDETMARVEGLPTRALYVLLLVLLSVTIVVALRAVGFLMVSALLILPAATANLLSRNFNHVMALSLVAGVVGVMGGLGLNLTVLADLPAGATIVLTLFALFTLAFAATGLARRRQP